MNQESKTITQWLKELPESHKSKAINNLNRSRRLRRNTKGYRYTNKYLSLFRAMSCAFEWKETPQGHRFWSDFASQLLHENKPSNKKS